VVKLVEIVSSIAEMNKNRCIFRFSQKQMVVVSQLYIEISQ